MVMQIDDQFRQLMSGTEGDPMVVHFADIPRIMVSLAEYWLRILKSTCTGAVCNLASVAVLCLSLCCACIALQPTCSDLHSGDLHKPKFLHIILLQLRLHLQLNIVPTAHAFAGDSAADAAADGHLPKSPVKLP